MISLNSLEIALNEIKLAKIEKLANSKESLSLLRNCGLQIIREFKPKLPVDLNKRYVNTTSLSQQAFIVTNPFKKSVKVNSYKMEIPTILIKPKIYYKYYGIVISGNNTYNGVKKKLKYQSSLAVANVVSKTRNKYKKKLVVDFKNSILKSIDNIENGN